MNEYICAEDVICPNTNNHYATEALQLIDDCVYSCDCGCKFESYSGESAFVLESGWLKPKVTPKKRSLRDKIDLVIVGIALIMITGLSVGIVFMLCGAR